MKYVGLLLLFASVLIGYQAKAQTFYEIQFTDNSGTDCFGLMTYYDEENCSLRMQYTPQKKKNSILQVADYVAVSQQNEEANYLVMASESDNTPIFVWTWDDEETEEQQEKPYVTFDEEADVETWIRVEYFKEVTLEDMSEEYVAQFYSNEEPEYQQLCEAITSVKKSDETIFGDGQQIYETLNNMVQEAHQEVQNQPQTAEPNTLSTSNLTQENAEAVGRPVMHLMLLANTEVANIGASCRIDYNNMRNEMRGICQALGIELKEYDIIGLDYSKKSLIAKLDQLKPAANDIVIFLYTGHGFRFSNQQDLYPMLALATNDYQSMEDVNNYVALSDVYEAICQKGARLNLVLSDCCNSDYGVNIPMSGNTLFSRANNNFSKKRLTQLFFETKGSMMSTAASPGEYAIATEGGGVFTISFLQSLRKEISAMSEDDVSWGNLIDNTINIALKRSESVKKSNENLTLQTGMKKSTFLK